MILSPKRKQTYEEALKAMNDTTYPLHYLGEISSRHYTEELLEVAIRNGRCSLREIPTEKRSLRLCHATLERCRNEDIQYMPQKYFDFHFAMKAASLCPLALTTILYIFRQDRWKEPYTLEDMRIIAEAACPRERGQWQLDHVSDPASELQSQTFEEYCSRKFGFVHVNYANLYQKALNAYITKIEEEQNHD